MEMWNLLSLKQAFFLMTSRRRVNKPAWKQAWEDDLAKQFPNDFMVSY